VQRPARWGNYRISYTYSKALDNVGEFFFSSPIDNSNIWRDYGRSDDDQRHRLVFDGTIHTSMAAAKNTWERLSHGFQLSGMLQYYSTLPLNITTGSNTIQGTGARPTVNGTFINRNAGSGSDFFSISSRVSRSFAFGERVHLQAIAEAFNTLNHRNNLTKNGTFAAGCGALSKRTRSGQDSLATLRVAGGRSARRRSAWRRRSSPMARSRSRWAACRRRKILTRVSPFWES
jgi:hypothetical protein